MATAQTVSGCPTGSCVSVGDRSQLEGDGATHTMSFPVTLSQPASSTVSVDYTVVGVTANGGSKPGSGADFKLKSGTLTFKPSAGSGLTPIAKTIAVTVYGDTSVEPDETFHVVLSNPTGGGVVLGRSQATGTILNDDINPGSTMGIGDASIVATHGGSQSLKFAVTLSAKASSQVTINYVVAPGTATFSKKSTGGGNYGGKVSGTLTFKVAKSGFTPNVATISIPIWPGALGSDKTLAVTLSGLTGTGVTLLRPTATGTIIGGY
jgi:hypothetical protein